MTRAMLAAALLLATAVARAGDVEVVSARFAGGAGGTWRVSVTLRHDDTGWEHYADAWRVVSEGDDVYGTRTLYHPHENEQPFTRSLDGVRVPDAQAVVYIEAHDKVHGWASARLRVDLREASGPGFTVER